jgi:hypothetical protein
LDSVPGDPGYSPLWRVYAVTWSDAATPRELKSEAEITAAQQAVELSIETTRLVANAPVAAAQPPLIEGFFNGQTAKYMVTDISSAADAALLSEKTGYLVTFVASLAAAPETSLGKLYLFTNGVAGSNPLGFQANVLSAIPGEQGYSPLWSQYAVTWAASATPRELKSEVEITAAQQVGELVAEKTPLVQNSPVIPSPEEEATVSPSPSPSPAP